jgi:isopenicillin N synthase-like dioxygenase
VEWADLITLDLSTFDSPGGKEKLASQLSDAINKIGFFYITNFGLSQEEVDRQFAIGKELYTLPTEELLKYRADLENGGYNGYKPKGLRELAPGIFDVSCSRIQPLSFSFCNVHSMNSDNLSFDQALTHV